MSQQQIYVTIIQREEAGVKLASKDGRGSSWLAAVLQQRWREAKEEEMKASWTSCIERQSDRAAAGAAAAV